jgi:hypothetical protein
VALHTDSRKQTRRENIRQYGKTYKWLLHNQYSLLSEKHTKGRKGRSRFQTAGKALKRDFRTFMSKVFPCVPAPKTPATDPAEPTDRESPVIMQCCSLE